MSISLVTEPYAAQKLRWPSEGRPILAQFDAETIVVYQAFRPETALAAAEAGRFGKGFSLSRMSWIKPNFLWMMYRSGWAGKEGQEHVLAIRIRREGFDEILAQAVHSSFVSEVYGAKEAWEEAVKRSSVRLQWDPDHDPSGAPVERRAIQLGLRDVALRRYAQEWTVSIEDITDFVREQHVNARGRDYEELLIPREEPYPVTDPAVKAKLGITTSLESSP